MDLEELYIEKQTKIENESKNNNRKKHNKIIIRRNNEDKINGYLLIKSRYNNIKGWIIIHSKKWIFYLSNLKYPLLYRKDSVWLKLYNEEEYMEVLNLQVISKEEYDIIKKLFGEHGGDFIYNEISV